MFNSISGVLTFKNREKAFLRSSGIEWDISISGHTSSLLPNEGSEAVLYVFLLHREDKMQLFGFSTNEERNIFFDLIKVESIGPASALRILSGISPQDIGKAIDAGDTDLLSRIPGIGKKTAEKIVFRLKGKIAASVEQPLHEEIARALSGMGFDLGRARSAVRESANEIDAAGKSSEELEAEILRVALKKLGTHG
jgi:Holliday junction DNA helicase RuvA